MLLNGSVKYFTSSLALFPYASQTAGQNWNTALAMGIKSGKEDRKEEKKNVQKNLSFRKKFQSTSHVQPYINARLEELKKETFNQTVLNSDTSIDKHEGREDVVS